MCRARQRLIAACLAFLLVPVLKLHAQQGGVGNIIGELQVTRGDFPGRVFVELQFRGATIASTYSDDEGKFGFNGLESNPYRVVIRDDRFNPVDQLVVLDTSIATLSMTHINLTAREATQNDSLPPRKQGSNPNIIDPSEYRRHFPKAAVKEFDRGAQADKRHKLDDAIAHYEKAIALAPDFYPAHNNLGSDYLSKADLTAAEKQFREALRLNQGDSPAYFNLGHVLLIKREFPEAEKLLRDGLQKQPDSAFGLFLLGSLYSHSGRATEAERNLRSALQSDPKMQEAYLQLVNLYLQQNRRSDAISELQTFLSQFPDGSLTPKAKQVLKKLQEEQPSSVAR